MNNLEILKEKCSSCELCELSKSRSNVVFGKGNPNAEILFIGEAPGAKEDELGLPFVGRAGKELDKLLQKIELTIDDVYIANILKCRPPKNRDPKKDEIKTCTPYLIEQIKLINPKIIATLGNYSTKFVLSGFNTDKMKEIQGISEIHGTKKKIEIDNWNESETESGIEKEKGDKMKYLVIPIYHPSAMMYNPKLRKDFENDFRKFAEIIGTKFIEETEVQKSLI